MRFPIEDYQRMFELSECMNAIKYPGGSCMQSKVGKYITIRYDKQLIQCSFLDVISALLLDRFVDVKNKRCKTPNCVNPFHYIML